MSPISRSWRRIDEWLAANAPNSRALLNPPATGQRLAAAEATLGFALPAEVAASLSAHDGMAEWIELLPWTATPLSAARLVELWEVRGAEYDPDDYEPDEPAEHWWNPRWVPWARSAAADLLIVDNRPGPGRGRLGWAFVSEGASFDRFGGLPGSLAEFLELTAEALAGDASVMGCRPRVERGRLSWETA